MKTKKVVGFILKLPVILLVLGAFGAAIYAAYSDKYICTAENAGECIRYGITWASSIIIGVLIILYLIGSYLSRTKKSEKNEIVNVSDKDKEKIKK